MTTKGGVLIVGAGGHALVSIEVLRSMGKSIRGCLSLDGHPSADIARLGVSMLGTDREVDQIIGNDPTECFVAIGDNASREAVVERVLANPRARLVTALSAAATVSPSAEVAEGVLVMPGVVVNANAKLGTGCIINTAASIDHECEIGPFAHIAPNATLAGNVTVGAHALVGAGSVASPGTTIGDRAVVGTGATVVRDVACNSTVIGNPARPVDLNQDPAVPHDTNS